MESKAMKHFGKSTALLFIFIYLVSASSCSKDFYREYDFFLIPVDGIYFSDDPATGQLFEIRFSGLIGQNGCYRFSRFIVKPQGNEILIEAWGMFDKTSAICSDEMVSLDREKLNYLIEDPGTYILKVKQPDGRYMERTFKVE
jgi:hypothetical protein